MQKKSKKVLLIVVSVLFVLSVGYFALLAPTTAWFFQKTDKPYVFTFADFDTEVTSTIDDLTVPLRAATRFADTDETLFDEVVHVVKVQAENHAGKAAQVRVSVVEGDENPTGLHWFLMKAPEVQEGDEPLTYKTIIESKLGESMGLKSYQLIAATQTKSVEQQYEEYNQGALEVLNAHNKMPVPVEAGESADIYLVFWAEYGEVIAEGLDADDLVTIGDYNVDITFTAEPYSNPTATMTMHSLSAVQVKILVPENENTSVCTEPYVGTYYVGDREFTTVDGTIEVGRYGYESDLRNILTGTRFKLQILTEGYVFEDSGKSFTTGTVNSIGNTINIVSE